MRNSVINVVELILGALLIGLGLLYLMTQYRSLTQLTDIITMQAVGGDRVYQQYNLANTMEVADEEVYAAIMGYKEYPIMVDDKLIPLNGHDYELYFSYIRDGYYKKDYRYERDRQIVMVLYTYMGV
ncbi:MAG: hypothetical protein GX129_00220 [Clostridiales bacterium]|jgi:2',3'-cyclic-nucleotide 2'-phosphodiesterase (5'-nucleotidase family)|nr:hypothetical protein [Clostridiales bacterium]